MGYGLVVVGYELGVIDKDLRVQGYGLWISQYTLPCQGNAASDKELRQILMQ